MTGLGSDVLGALRLNKVGLVNRALEFVVGEKTAAAVCLAYELSSGFKDGKFSMANVNSGTVAALGMKAFGLSESPMMHLGGMAAIRTVGPTFAVGAGALAAMFGGGAAAAGTAAAGGVVAADSALGAVSRSMAGIGGGGVHGLAGTARHFLGGGNSADLRNAFGLQRNNRGPGSMLASLPRPAYFEDIIAAFMIDTIKDKQDEVEKRLMDMDRKSNESKSVGNQAGGTVRGLGERMFGKAGKAEADATTNGNSDSRNIQFELVKNEIQKLSQMQQALSNVLNTMHEQAMNAIRHIKA